MADNCPFCNQMMGAGVQLSPQAQAFMQAIQDIPPATAQTNAAAQQSLGPIPNFNSQMLGKLRPQNLTGPASPNDLSILGFK